VSAGGLQAWLERWLRIPPPPRPPAGSPDSIRVFRAAPGFYRYQLLRWGGGQLGAAWGLVAGFSALAWLPELPYGWLLRWAELVGVAAFLLQLPFTLLLVKVDVDYRWYVVTDRSLRIREGVFRVREQTMSFANVQNLAVRQGPLQRLLGIADLRVRTAGGGGKEDPGTGEGSANLHLGTFRGVADAEGIRDVVLERLRRHRDAGLGDPDEEPDPAEPCGGPILEAARLLLTEARALRREIAGGP